MQRTCRTNGWVATPGSTVHIPANILVDHHQKLAYCIVPKVTLHKLVYIYVDQKNVISSGVDLLLSWGKLFLSKEIVLFADGAFCKNLSLEKTFLLEEAYLFLWSR
jgi:hypothetical protein